MTSQLNYVTKLSGSRPGWGGGAKCHVKDSVLSFPHLAPEPSSVPSIVGPDTVQHVNIIGFDPT